VPLLPPLLNPLSNNYVSVSYLIVGLGNIGAEYANTRHNIGFSVLDALAVASNTSFSVLRYGSLTQLKIRGKKVWLLKPSTYVNLSGKAVNYWMQEERIPLENVLIVLDDVALPFGKLRMRAQGSDGGHNGLKNISAVLGTNAYARLRIGVGDNFPKGMQVDYVLGTWTNEQVKEMPFVLDNAASAVNLFVCEGVTRAMNTVNTQSSED
jgi:PTH1 family peptidyl-tRNA hydrolase